MATRLYYSSSAIAAISPAIDGSWEQSTSMIRRILQASPAGSAMASTAIATTLNSPAGAVDVAMGQFVSPPLQGSGTISSGIKGQIRALEAATAADARAQVVIRVLSEDGTTIRGTLYGPDVAVLSSEFDAVTLTNRKFPRGGTVTPTPVSYQDRDRIVVEVGWRKGENATTSRTGTLRFGDAIGGTDLPQDETTTADNNPWIEFGDALGFYGEVDFLAATRNTVNGTSLTATVPAGVRDGDCLVLIVAQVGSWVGPGSLTAPASGWTRLDGGYHEAGEEAGGNATAFRIYYRIASSEPGSYTVTWTHSGKTVVDMIAVRGADTSDPILGIRCGKGQSGGNTLTPPVRALYFLPTGALALALMAFGRGGTTFSVPSGYTNTGSTGQFDSDTTLASIYYGSAYRKFTSRSGIPATSWSNTNSNSSNWETYALAFRPAGANVLALRSLGALSAVASGTALTLGAPPDVHSGDLLVGMVGTLRPSASVSTITPPAGWSTYASDQVANVSDATSPESILAGLFYKTAAGGDSYAFTLGASVNDATGYALAFAGNPSPTIAGGAVAADASKNGTQTIPGVTLSDYAADVLLLEWVYISNRTSGVGAASGFDGLAFFTPPSGVRSSTGGGIELYTTANPPATSVATSTSVYCVAMQYAIGRILDGVGARRAVVIV